MLDRGARARLRTLGKNNADLVARHLIMAGRLIDDEPELSYAHAQAAMRRAGRVDVVREALAVTAYSTGRYAEALRELRTVRRLSGIDAHRPMEADCERGLGRPERALAIVAETDTSELSEEDSTELAIVASSARADLGEHEAGLLVLESPLVEKVTRPDLTRRLAVVRAERLEELGRTDEAAALREAIGPEPEPEEDIVVVDLAEEYDAGEDDDVAEDRPGYDSADESTERSVDEPESDALQEPGEVGQSEEVEPSGAPQATDAAELAGDADQSSGPEITEDDTSVKEDDAASVKEDDTPVEQSTAPVGDAAPAGEQSSADVDGAGEDPQ
ncbi:hypothetical protein [Georgenia sp. AZ-5]|uniref:hypothetical protein n=1 Tax=Georgenia sp. AZ-5 TaxID=3367526 RepID=UPI003753FADC